jgi:cyclohexadienyl dehydratase
LRLNNNTLDEDADGGGLPQLLQRGSVRVCSTGDYRPFTFRDSQGNWSGLDIEMAHDMAARLGVRLDLVPTRWASLVNDLGNKCDVAMGGISITLDRAKHAGYSAPYLRDGKAAIVRCDDRSKFQTLADIDRPGVRVVVNPGGTNAQFDKDHLHFAQVVDYPDNNTIFEQLTDNAADVMITDTSEIRWQTDQNPQLCGVSWITRSRSSRRAISSPRRRPTCSSGSISGSTSHRTTERTRH